MEIFVIPYPIIDPVAVRLGPFAIHWYALAYIGSLALGWLYISLLLRDNRLWGKTVRPPEKNRRVYPDPGHR